MNPFQSLLWALMAQFFSPRHNAQIRLLKAQIKILQDRLPQKRVIPSPKEKAELLRLGGACGHDITDLMEVVKPGTYRRWINQSSKGKPFKPLGRPRLTKELRDMALRMARENLLWGYLRIAGELKKIGFHISGTSVRRILIEGGLHPSPEKKKRKPPLPWMTFIRAHMESMVACDFFTKTVYTAKGPKAAYVLVFIHLRSRRVHCGAPTYSPDSAWVTQQARNATMWCADQGIKPRFLIRDADAKFSGPFNQIWKSEGARVIQIPHRAPQANAFAESFIGTLKRECLDFFVCFSRSQLDFIIRSWISHYNTSRPHQGHGMDNSVLQPDFHPIRDGPVRCRTALGGIIKSYYREAA